VVARVDGAADVARRPDGPVLLEVGLVAVDRGRVDALLLPDLVRAPITLQAAVLCRAAVVRRVVVAQRLDHIVLDQRVARPAVEREVCRAAGGEGASIVNKPAEGLVNRFTCHQPSDVGYPGPCWECSHVSAGLIASPDHKVASEPVVPHR